MRHALDLNTYKFKMITIVHFVSDIAVFVLKRYVELQLTHHCPLPPRLLVACSTFTFSCSARQLRVVQFNVAEAAGSFYVD